MKYLFFLLILLPSLNFGIVSTATMPWALILLPFYLKKVFYPFLGAVIFLILVTILNFVFFDFKVSGVLQSSLALLNATIIIPLILNSDTYDLEIIIKSIKIFLITSLIFGLFQFFIADFRIITAFLFGHSSGFGAKGVSSLSYEPSRAAMDIFICSLGLIFLRRKGYVKINKTLIVSLLVFLILINRSITGFVFITIYFFTYLFLKFNLKFILSSILAFFLITILLFFFLDYIADFHLIDSLIRFYNSENKMQLIHILSGHRTTGFLSSLSSLSFFGHGFGNWDIVVEDFLIQNYDTVSKIPFYRSSGIVPTIPITFFGRFIIEIGVFGLFLYFLILLNKRLSTNLFIRLMKEPETLTLLVILSVLSYGGSPVPFLILSVMYVFHKKKYLKSDSELLVN